jgi:DNA-binding XRE family transcriptional regulator
MILSEKIYRLRRERHISQEELAVQMNVSRQAVSKWESGQAIPDTNNIILLSQILNVSIDYLLREDAPVSVQLAQPQRKRSRWLLVGAIMCTAGFFGGVICSASILLNSLAASGDAETGTISFHINGYFMAAFLSSFVLAIGAIILLIMRFRK